MCVIWLDKHVYRHRHMYIIDMCIDTCMRMCACEKMLGARAPQGRIEYAAEKPLDPRGSKGLGKSTYPLQQRFRLCERSLFWDPRSWLPEKQHAGRIEPQTRKKTKLNWHSLFYKTLHVKNARLYLAASRTLLV